VHHTMVIAEIGVNHNGRLETARDLVTAARDAGADFVKTQTFDPAMLATRAASMAPYQERNGAVGASQREMLEAYRLSTEETASLVEFAESLGVGFLSTPFDVASLNTLTKELGLTTIKLSSGDLTNGPLLLATARAADSVIVSTGMSTMAEVQEALEVLAFGFTSEASAVPSRDGLAQVWSNGAARATLDRRVSLLHCVSAYPAPVGEVNLRAMDSMRAEFGLPVGFSDHTTGTTISLAAVARGATIIEKHLTLDSSQSGPDHAASIEPREFEQMVVGIRAIEAALGDGFKVPMPSETQALRDGRRSVRASRRIGQGQMIHEDDLVVLRPADGLSPMRLWELLDRPAGRDFEPEQCIE
jgi:sialic acid synthase SpsE